MKKRLFKVTSFLLVIGLFVQLASAAAAETTPAPTNSNDFQKPDQWQMVEPGAGGAFFSVGAGPASEKYPHGIAVAASDLSGPYLSYDNGKTWENRGYWNGLVYHNHTSMVGFIPDDANVVFIGAEDIMYKSDDGGHQFYPILSEDWDPWKRTGTFKVVRDLKPGEIGTKYKDPLGDVHYEWSDAEDGALLYFTSMTFSKSNPNIGYAAAHHNWEGTDAVIFKTTDRGETWNPVKVFLNEYDSDDTLVKFNENMRVQKIVVDYTNPDHLYILSQPDQFTEESGLYWEGPKSSIYRSVNGGKDWEIVAGDKHSYPAYGGDNGMGLPLYDPDGQQQFYLHTNGEYRATYQKSGTLEEPLFMRFVSDFEMDPVDPNVIYVSKGNRRNLNLPGKGLYKGTFSKGAWSWEKLTDTFGIVKVKEEKGNSVVRLFDIRGWSDTQPSEEQRNYPKVYEYHSNKAEKGFELIAEATKPGTFELGAIHHYYSTSPAYVKTIAASMANPDSYFWVDSQWVFRSDDGARSFKSAASTSRTDEEGNWYSTTGVSNVVSFSLKISEANPNIIYTGNADIGFWRSKDNGRSWQHSNQADFVSDWKGIGGQAQAILPDPDRENVVWAGLGGYYVDQILVKSTDYGANGSWVESHKGLPKSESPRWNSYQNGAAIRGLSLDKTSPINNRTLYVVADDVVFKSVDDGTSWKQVLDMREATGKDPYEYNGFETWDVNPDRTAATAVDPTDGKYVYAGGADGFFRSTDKGATWEQVGGVEFEGVQKIIVSKQNPEHVFVAIGPYQNEDGETYNSPGLYRSTDRGVTWEKIFEDEFLRGFDVNPLDENIIIAGSANVWIAGGVPESSGAWLTVDGGESWQQVNEGLSWPYVRDVEMNPHDPSQVFIVTPGTSHHVRYFDYSKYKDGEPQVSELEALQNLLDQYIASGKVNGPLVNQLSNSLDQAVHQFNKGSNKQAVKKVEDFQKHLNNAPKQKNISSDAKESLNKAAQALIKAWSK
ncbi:WD40/YVTN/BNR-like repeat-containing protein [Lederbergia citrea]|uniref:WD40/YVTN/BNR-like repeat-containing protein n=1 Tax=Lederbergia citrea TaxID=2833581 RepID=UPI001BC9775E|nr:hypothetical protein [Lederbergia citrea]MBS4178749.1 hypothetical protein [Lederbergia citrea]